MTREEQQRFASGLTALICLVALSLPPFFTLGWFCLVVCVIVNIALAFL